MGETMKAGGTMGSVVGGFDAPSNWRDRASALTFLEPGQYDDDPYGITLYSL